MPEIQKLFLEGQAPGIPFSFRLVRKHGEDLLLLPIEPELAIATSAIYPAQSRAARGGVLGLKALFKFGLAIFIPKRQLAIREGDEFGEYLRSLSGAPTLAALRFGVLCGNPRASGRRFTFLIFTPQGKPVAVVKAGSTAEARGLVHAEAETIQELPRKPGVTKLLSRFESKDISAFAMPYFPERCHPSASSGLALEFLTAWIAGGEYRELGSLPAWERLKRVCSGNSHFESLRHTLEPLRIRPVLWHGDFVPWNIRVQDGRWKVIDWERAETNGVPGWDWFHFVLQRDLLVRKGTAQEVLDLCLAAIKSPNFKSYARQTGIVGVEEEILVAFLLYSNNVCLQWDAREQIGAVLALALEHLSAEKRNGCDFSIITPSFRQLDWLRLCISSVKDQAVNGLRVEQIVQDAGTEGIEEIENQRDDLSRAGYDLRVERETDSGMYDAINRGFRKAQGKYLAWLNSDEQYLPGALSEVASYFEKNPEVDVVFGDAILLDEDGHVISYRRPALPFSLHIRLCHLGTLSCATFVRRKVIDQGHLLDDHWRTIADAVWVDRLLKSNFRVGMLRKALAAFTMTKSNLGQTSLAYEEGEEWKKQMPKWSKLLKAPASAYYRFKKLLAGSYVHRNLATAIYVRDGMGRRVPATAASLRTTWPSQDAAMERRRKKADADKLKRFILLGIILPTGFALLVKALEVKIGIVTLTPVLSLAFLLCLTFLAEPKAVALAGFLLLTNVVLTFFARLGTPVMEPAGVTYVVVRSASFALAAVLAVFFSLERRRSEGLLRKVSQVLEWMPAPLFVSDASGMITFANRSAARALQSEAEKLVGKNWWEIFMPEMEIGKGSRSYIRMFEEIGNLPKSCTVTLGNGNQIGARMLKLGYGGFKQLLTMLDGSSQDDIHS